MLKLNLRDAARAVGAQEMPDAPVEHVVVDSRLVVPNTVFVAIRGENNDGHAYIADALSRGAAAAVASRLPEGVSPRKILLVPDTKRALLQIAGLWRDNFSIPVVGVTGSVGKTTTKEMTAAVLSARFCTHKTQGNLNNELGVPWTLFDLNESHGAAVIEMGMSGPGEIAQLAAAVRPTAGIITMIGVSHMERLGSREGILKAKLELADALPGGAPLVLNADDGLLFSAAGRYAHLNVLFFGVENPAAHVRAKDVRAQGARTDFTIVSPWGEFAAAVPALGEHNVKNALAAFCAGCALGVAPKDAAAALENYQTTGMRQRVTPFAGATVVEDCYNCSPDSLAAAAKTLAGWPGAKRRILVLSDMLELGGREKDMHRECGCFIAKTGVDTLFLCGELSRETAAGACEGGLDSCAWFSSMDEMAMALKQLLAPGDVVWLKASRGMRLERVLERLYERKEDV